MERSENMKKHVLIAIATLCACLPLWAQLGQASVLLAEDLVERTEQVRQVKVPSIQGQTDCELHALMFTHTLSNGRTVNIHALILYSQATKTFWWWADRMEDNTSLDRYLTLFTQFHNPVLQMGKLTVLSAVGANLIIRTSRESSSDYAGAKAFVTQWLRVKVLPGIEATPKMGFIPENLMPKYREVNLALVISREFLRDPTNDSASGPMELFKVIQARPVGEKIEVEVKGPRYSEILTIDADLAVKHVRK